MKPLHLLILAGLAYIGYSLGKKAGIALATTPGYQAANQLTSPVQTPTAAGTGAAAANQVFGTPATTTTPAMQAAQ